MTTSETESEQDSTSAPTPEDPTPTRVGVLRPAHLVAAYRAWAADRAARLGAALAYYSLFALVPVLFLSISLAGLVFGKDVAGSTVEDSIADLLGIDIATQMSGAIDQLRAEGNTAALPLVSFGALLFAASLLFVAWKELVDLIWDIPREAGIAGTISRRVFGVAVVVAAGLLLAVTIFAETLVGAVDRFVDNPAADAIVKVTSSAVPLALGSLFFMALLMLTPETRVRWQSAAPAALVTMLMASVGAWAYGLYLSRYGFASASGVAGTLLLGLVFLYYAAQIMLYGVELSKVLETDSAPRSRTAPAT